MPGRTFAIGDIHGDVGSLYKLLSCFPELRPDDTLVFMGDYVDRGPRAKDVVEFVRHLPSQTRAKVVPLRGNHEDAWLRVIDRGWPEFTVPISNGCLATLRSFRGQPPPREDEPMNSDEMACVLKGAFFPPDVVAWMRTLPFFYEDAHAIYVHAGLPRRDGRFLHPSEVEPPSTLLWCRDDEFFRSYSGKLVVFGHTATEVLPAELSTYTPEDPMDLWAAACTIGLDTGCGKGGFLTAIELPTMRVYDSR